MPTAPTEEPVTRPSEPTPSEPVPQPTRPSRTPEADPFDPPWPENRPMPQPKAACAIGYVPHAAKLVQ